MSFNIILPHLPGLGRPTPHRVFSETHLSPTPPAFGTCFLQSSNITIFTLFPQFSSHLLANFPEKLVQV